MATEVRLPELGEGVERADVVRVLVAPGDTVAVDQPLLEIETDKATVEVPSPVAGTVTAVAAEAGATLAVGAAHRLARIGRRVVGCGRGGSSFGRDQDPQLRPLPRAGLPHPESRSATRPAASALGAQTPAAAAGVVSPHRPLHRTTGVVTVAGNGAGRRRPPNRSPSTPGAARWQPPPCASWRERSVSISTPWRARVPTAG